jgi:hypothetical protein
LRRCPFPRPCRLRCTPTCRQALSAWSNWIVTLKDIGKPLLVGTPIFSIGFSPLAYLLVKGAWHLRVPMKRRRRARHL